MNQVKPSGRVAVITRTKDRPLFLRRAAHSVLEQSFGDWVHVIVNDGGDPAPVDLLVRELADLYAGRVQVVHHDTSKGMQNASNAGIEAVDSEFIVIHDDDDSWHEDFLLKMVAALEQPDSHRKVQGAACQSMQIFEEVTAHGEIHEIKQHAYQYYTFAGLNEMRRRNLFPPIAFLYRRLVHDQIGMFRQEFDVLGDHDFNLRFLRHFDIVVLKDFLANYHWRFGSQGNTVTSGVEKHRVHLNHLKNVYLRETLSGSPDAIGDLDAIDMPPPAARMGPPFKRRELEEAAPVPLPDIWSAGFSFKCISLDVFDTALHRRCNRPTDVFQFLQERLNGAHVEMSSDGTIPFAQARKGAEQLARRRAFPDAPKDFNGEVSLEQIYQCFGELLDLPKARVREAMQLELELEKELLYANPVILKLVREAQRRGVAVVFASDMYLSSAQIRELLTSAGYPDLPVYVSSEIQLSKHNGDLYAHIAAELNLQPSDMLHIGDNHHADFVRAQQAGLQAIHWDCSLHCTQPWLDQVAPHYYQPGDLWSLRAAGEVRRLAWERGANEMDRLERLGLELAGPLYHAYVRWFLQTAKREGIRRLLLLGRDGYYWEKTLQVIAEKEDVDIAFSYFPASRKVLNFASFEGLDQHALDFLLTPHPALKARDFIERLGLDAGPYQQRLAAIGFDDMERVLTSKNGGRYLQPEDANKMRHFFLLIRDDLEPLFAEDRKALLQQLEEHQFAIEDTAIVDLGWAASSAKALSRLLKTTAEAPLRSFYFGTWIEGEAKKDHYKTFSYFMDLGEPAAHALLVGESVNWIESLHGAPFSTLLGLRTHEGKVEPVYAEGSDGGFSAEQQGRIWKGAEAFIRAMEEKPADLFGSVCGFNYLYLALHRLLREPTQSEIAEWGGLLHSDGFGLERYRPLIMPLPDSPTPDDLIELFYASSWQRGFLSSIDPESRAFVESRTMPREAKTYQELEGELIWKIRECDRMWMEIRDLKTQIQRLHDESTRQGQIWQDNQDEIHRRGERIQEQENRYGALQQQLTSLGRENENMHVIKSQLEARIAELGAFLKQSQELAHDAELENQQLLQKMDELNQHFLGYQTETGTALERLNLEKQELHSHHQSATAELSLLKQNILELQKSHQEKSDLLRKPLRAFWYAMRSRE